MASNPGFINGQKPTASQLNGYFTVKADDRDFVGDSGSGGIAGLVPAPPSGAAADEKFLFADGTWQPVGGGVTIPEADLLGGADDDTLKPITLGNGLYFSGEGQEILNAGLAIFSISSETNNFTVPSGETGSQYNNNGAVAEVDFTLPAATTGLNYGFLVSAAQTLKIIRAGSDTISVGTAISAVTNISSDVPQSFIWLICHVTGKWSAMSVVGSWSG